MTGHRRPGSLPPKNADYKAVRDLAFSPDGSRLAASYADGRARIWHVARAEVERTLYTPAEGLIKELHDVTYLPDGARIATVGGDFTVRLWDGATGDSVGGAARSRARRQHRRRES